MMLFASIQEAECVDFSVNHLSSVGRSSVTHIEEGAGGGHHRRADCRQALRRLYEVADQAAGGVADAGVDGLLDGGAGC